MRIMTKTLGALAIAGALGLGASTPTLAQGVYFEGPGVGLHVGPTWHHRYYRDYDRPYYRPWRGYDYGYRRRWRDWD